VPQNWNSLQERYKKCSRAYDKNQLQYQTCCSSSTPENISASIVRSTSSWPFNYNLQVTLLNDNDNNNNTNNVWISVAQNKLSSVAFTAVQTNTSLVFCTDMNAERMLAGKLFHIRGTATAQLRMPSTVLVVWTTTQLRKHENTYTTMDWVLKSHS